MRVAGEPAEGDEDRGCAEEECGSAWDRGGSGLAETREAEQVVV